MAWETSGRVIIVGLGNPSSKYHGTRHNIGFLLVDALAYQLGVSVAKQKFKGLMAQANWGRASVVLLKPQTYMNLSGQSVVPALSFYDVEPPRMIVCHDDIDLPFGDVRVKKGGGHGGHNGLRSIVGESGRRDFLRIRLGVGRPAFGSVTSHVLGRFHALELAELPSVLDRGLLGLRVLIEEGPKQAMDAVNGLYRSLMKQETGDDG